MDDRESAICRALVNGWPSGRCAPGATVMMYRCNCAARAAHLRFVDPDVPDWLGFVAQQAADVERFSGTWLLIGSRRAPGIFSVGGVY